MATINNSNLTKEIIDGAKIQISHDIVPSQIAEKVVPVMEVNPKLLKKCNILKHAIAINATATTIYAVPSDREFYLCGCSLSMIKDASSTSLYSGIQVAAFGNGDFFRPLTIIGITSTAQSGEKTVTISPPIRLQPSTNISLINSTNSANVSSFGAIWGYTVED